MTRFLVAYAAYVAAVHLIPGPWQTPRTEVKYLDGWALTHAAWGAIARRAGIPLGTLVVLATLNEVAEYLTHRAAPQLTWGQEEPLPYRVWDVAVTTAGWAVGGDR